MELIVVKAEQLNACRRTLTEIMDLLNSSIRRKNHTLENAGRYLVWPLSKKDHAKSLLDELERHKSILDLAFSADIW
jgi:hypothetical protein